MIECDILHMDLSPEINKAFTEVYIVGDKKTVLVAEIDEDGTSFVLKSIQSREEFNPDKHLFLYSKLPVESRAYSISGIIEKLLIEPAIHEIEDDTVELAIEKNEEDYCKGVYVGTSKVIIGEGHFDRFPLEFKFRVDDSLSRKIIGKDWGFATSEAFDKWWAICQYNLYVKVNEKKDI